MAETLTDTTRARQIGRTLHEDGKRRDACWPAISEAFPGVDEEERARLTAWAVATYDAAFAEAHPFPEDDADEHDAEHDAEVIRAFVEDCIARDAFPVPAHVPLRPDNGYLSVTTLRRRVADLTREAEDG